MRARARENLQSPQNGVGGDQRPIYLPSSESYPRKPHVVIILRPLSSDAPQSVHQSTHPPGPYFSSSHSFAFLKCPLPKKPLLALSGDGCWRYTNRADDMSQGTASANGKRDSKLTALVRTRCFFCVEGSSFQPARCRCSRKKELSIVDARTNLVELRHPLRRPRAPREKDDAAAVAREAGALGRQVRAAVLVDDVDDLVRELFPPLVRVGPGRVRLDGQTGIEQEDPVLRPGSKVPAQDRRVSRRSSICQNVPPPMMMQSAARLLPMVGRIELRVLILDFLVDLSVGNALAPARVCRGARAAAGGPNDVRFSETAGP